MQADFSRTTFDAAKHFSAVLAQQGRVQLDADVNEQAAILLHQLRTAVADIVGPAGAPAGQDGGFAISEVTGKTPREDLAISRGRMYVNGVLAENASATTYWEQPDGYFDADNVADELPPSSPFIVYLRVWERLITAVQDPSIREIALGDPGPDTAARARTVWQVATHPVTATTGPDAVAEFNTWVGGLRTTGTLKADAKRPSDGTENPCHLPPDSRFRGPENQLYRVEVHTGGKAWPSTHAPTSMRGTRGGRHLDGATFTWSRENASVVFPIVSIAGAVVEVATLGRDGKLHLEVGDWVEIVDDASASRVADDVLLTDPPRSAPRLRKVLEVDPADRLVTLDQRDDDSDSGIGPHPVLRRWDHASTHIGTAPVDFAADGAVPITEGQWIDLEDGVQVLFQPNAQVKDSGTYRRGDYWLIPARTVTGDVLWPQDGNGVVAKDPDGVEYHYTPLAFVSGSTVDGTLRHTFTPLSPPL